MDTTGQKQALNRACRLRMQKLAQLRRMGNAFPNDFRRDATADGLHQLYAHFSKKTLHVQKISVRVAGRLMIQRVRGRATFITLQDMGGHILLYVSSKGIGQTRYEQHLRMFDPGDIIGAVGTLFKTHAGELTIECSELRLLTKAVKPLPDKQHALLDRESRYHQRYLDLIAHEKSRSTFRSRSNIISTIRSFMNARQFIEVETPLLLRISTQLYLQQLVLGGFERVYEINRRFRMAPGLPPHQPEFTTMELSMAYADYKDMIDLTEALFRRIALEVAGTMVIRPGNCIFDFGKAFARLTMKEAIIKHGPRIMMEELDSPVLSAGLAVRLGIIPQTSWGHGRIITEIFNITAKSKLIQPTFITHCPYEVSPLSRGGTENPSLIENFELFVGGRKISDGFSVENDAVAQAERFRDQVYLHEGKDDIASFHNRDYVNAIEHGLPPAAGLGINIDRLVMLLTGSATLTEVILFPQCQSLQ